MVPHHRLVVRHRGAHHVGSRPGVVAHASSHLTGIHVEIICTHAHTESRAYNTLLSVCRHCYQCCTFIIIAIINAVHLPSSLLSMLYIYYHHYYQCCTFTIITIINAVHLPSSLLSMLYIYYHHSYQCCTFTIIITVISAVHLSSVSLVSTSLLLSTWCICHRCSLIHRQRSLLVRCHCYQHHTFIISVHYQYIITSIISISSLLSMCYICHPRPLIHRQCSLLVHRHYYQCHTFIMCVHYQYIITIINIVHLSTMSINTSSVFIVSSSSPVHTAPLLQGGQRRWAANVHPKSTNTGTEQHSKGIT